MRPMSLLFFSALLYVSSASAADLDGIVVAEEGGVALSGIEVSLYGDTGTGWSLVSFTETDASGAYSFQDIDDAAYRLLFRDWSQQYAFEYSGDAATLDTASDVPVAGSTSYDAALSSAGRIAGALRGPDGQPVEFGFVAVFPDQLPLGDVLFIQQLGSGQSGYDIGGLPTGRYIARFSGQVDGQSAQEFYQDTPDAAFAAPIDVTVGQATAIDVVLGELSGLDLGGSVTDSGGDPLSGIEVSIYRWTGQQWSYQAYQQTPADGRYTFIDLAPGDYRVLFRDWSGVFAFQYWPNGTTIDDGQTVTIDDASQTVDAVMQAAGRISGQLSDPAGRPLLNSMIAVYGAWEPDQVLFLEQPTGVDYDIGGLPSGNYLVRFTGQQSNNRSYLEYYDGAVDAESATMVAVQVGTTTAGIDAELGLGPGGTIRGRLRGRYGEELDIGRVTALNWNDDQWVEVSTAEAFYLDDDFDYLLDVPAGRYRLRFEGGSFLAPNGQLETEYFDDAQSIDSAIDLDIATGDAQRDVDVRIGNFADGSIAGTVTDAQGNPAPGIEVLVFDRSLRLLSDQIAATDATGAFTVPELWPEEYFLRFYDPQGALQNRWYDDAESPSSAERVPVLGNVAGIDAVLAPASIDAPGSVSGRVTDESGQALGQIQVRAYTDCDFSTGQPVCDIVSRTETASDGSFRLRDLANGDYFVQFASSTGDYLTHFFPDAASIADASAVPVTAPAATQGVDAALPVGGAISGAVSNAFGDAFELLFVTAYRLVDGEYVVEQSTVEQDDTEYRISRLPTGTYRVGFSGGSWTGPRETEFFDDVDDLASATDLSVTAGFETGLIDAVLGATPGGSIAGTVTDDAAQPAAGITVKLYDDDVLDQQTLTDGAGHYSFTPLNSGIYFVEFEDSGGTLPGEFYLDVPSVDRATPIVVGEDPVSGVDAVLNGAQSSVGGGLISGIVTDSSGSPLSGIRVGCQPADPDAFDRLPCFGETGADGRYEIGGRLLAGDYEVRFSDPAGIYATEFYDDRILRAAADPVTALPGVETSGVDAVLSEGASIEGTVTRDGGGFYPITSVSLLRLNPGSGEWQFAAGSIQLDDGAYRIDGVPAGTYRVLFRGSSFSGVQNADVEFYDDVVDLADASEVILTAGQVLSGIDAVLGDLDGEGRAANAGFDEGIEGWSVSQPSAVAFSNRDVYANPESGAIEIAAGHTITIGQCVSVEVADPLEVEASIRSDAAADVELWLTSFDQAACGGPATTSERVASGQADPVWQRLQGGAEPRSGTRTIRVEVRVVAGTSPVQADGIDLRAATPTPVVFADSFE